MNSTSFVIEYLFCLIISWHVSEKYQEYFHWLLIYLIKCLSFLCISLFPWTTIYFKISSKIKKNEQEVVVHCCYLFRRFNERPLGNSRSGALLRAHAFSRYREVPQWKRVQQVPVRAQRQQQCLHLVRPHQLLFWRGAWCVQGSPG